MTRLPRRVELAVLLRSFTIQGSWNYETLIGTGFAFTVLPALRMLYGHDEEALRAAVARHASVFNSHPYLATVAAGAVTRLEAERHDPQLIERFKSALRGSLGSLGDQLVWGAWRPAAVLLGLALLLAGLAWWVAVGAFLVLYNSLHLLLRVWGLRIGSQNGLEVGRVLREAPLQALAQRAADVGAFLCGVVVVLVVAPLSEDRLQLGAALAGTGLGLWLGLRSSRLVGAAMALTWSVAIILGLAL